MSERESRKTKAVGGFCGLPHFGLAETETHFGVDVADSWPFGATQSTRRKVVGHAGTFRPTPSRKDISVSPKTKAAFRPPYSRRCIIRGNDSFGVLLAEFLKKKNIF